MRNITVSVDDETYRRSRIHAAKLDTSVSALVRGYLRTLATDSRRGSSGETPLERRRRLLHEVTEDFKRRGIGLDMAENLPRSELYDRDRARADAAEASGLKKGSASA